MLALNPVLPGILKYCSTKPTVSRARSPEYSPRTRSKYCATAGIGTGPTIGSVARWVPAEQARAEAIRAAANGMRIGERRQGTSTLDSTIEQDSQWPRAINNGFSRFGGSERIDPAWIQISRARDWGDEGHPGRTQSVLIRQIRSIRC
jgi:hypothetical protein